MMDQFAKLIAKKKAEGKTMSKPEMSAKDSVLQHLMSDMDDMGADKVKGLKKVTVAAPDKEGLEHGLAKAADLVEKGPLHSEDMDDVSDEGDDGNEEIPHDFEHHEGDSDEDEEADEEAIHPGIHHEVAEMHKAPHEMDHEELAHHIEQLKKLHQSKKSGY